jgi:hypothetical protein
MNKSLFVYMPAVLIGWFAALAPARAQSELPRNRVAYYNIHTDTQNPASPVLISMGVYLTAQDRIGDEVGWYPQSIVITQYNAQGGIVHSWIEVFPDPTSTDPLWYVTHADPMAPVSDEFTNPPELSGTADSVTPNGPKLDYFLLGKNAGSPPVTPYPITSIIDYSFKRSDEPEPIDADEDEPAETPPGDVT